MKVLMNGSPISKQPSPTKKVRVYRNLNKRCFSVKTKTITGQWKVSVYADWLVMKNVRFIVQEGGRKRVLKEGERNVHAYIEGERVHKTLELHLGREITYKPYTFPHFYFADNQEPVREAEMIYLVNGKVYEVVAST